MDSKGEAIRGSVEGSNQEKNTFPSPEGGVVSDIQPASSSTMLSRSGVWRCAWIKSRLMVPGSSLSGPQWTQERHRAQQLGRKVV